MLVLQLLVILILSLAATGIAIKLLNPLPPLEPGVRSEHLTDTDDTPLGRAISAGRAGHPDLSGVHVLANGREAFAARILLARAAVRSLDVQYYIWHGDLSGTLMLEEMREAADRGVRVRMLLDDNGVTGLDAKLAALDRHPNIEIRLFNPFVVRRPKMIGYLADFTRLNRRMHNKSFTADNQATIIGGRNVGDEYFGARDAGLFSDLDVVAIGEIVKDVSRDFDRYWSSPLAYPAGQILPAVARDELETLAGEAKRAQHHPAARAYMEAIRALPFIDQVLDGSLAFEWARIEMVSDDPAKALGRAREDKLLTTALRKAIGRPTDELYLVSGYFVPTQAGVDAFSQIASDGVRISIFTNAFAATDVWIVHAGYAERRRALLRAGVRLFEMRGPDEGDRPRRNIIGIGSGSGGGADGHVLRSSGSTLHAKTFAVDRDHLFVGSFNFDPRSMHLNTELGFVIHSPALASMVADAFKDTIPAQSYEVLLAPDGSLNWKETRAQGVVIHTTEPGTSAFQRSGIYILSHLPIEWLL
ncbi:phospholipase D family protein [Sphingobium yanoikuyae]|uniref:Phospholipase D n=1 Tax=Sphingobium yanoikuyae TaxID=13690 RepID=A0A6P1GDW2_SPHYA|nr:phospholipase D family protein [Sphingobium yanoikuyae]QHD66687.1 phospholipase D family protein [Sphingobium yanoikuyae]